MSAAAKVRPLTAAENRELALRVRAGDEKAREAMILGNLSLIMPWAARKAGAHLKFEDLMQEGAIGLDDAVRLYDPDQPETFGTYAVYRIRHAVGCAVRDRESEIRVPAYLSEGDEAGSRFQEDARRARSVHPLLLDRSRTGRGGHSQEPEARGREHDPGDLIDLVHALATLSPVDRRLIDLRFYRGLEYPDVARESGGGTHQWAQQRVARAVSRLRYVFFPEEAPPPKPPPGPPDPAHYGIVPGVTRSGLWTALDVVRERRPGGKPLIVAHCRCDCGTERNLRIGVFQRAGAPGGSHCCGCAPRRRTGRLVEARGESKTVREWAEVSGVHAKAIHRRLGLGWTPEDAVFTPTAADRKDKPTTGRVRREE
jgi:RNA polymerase sigma factor (sigma-70 family)